VKKIRGDKQLGLSNIYTWKYHEETHCVATFISNNQKCHVFLFIFSLFSSTKEQEGRTGLAQEGRIGTNKRR
jgi:hypothetical protein